MHPFPQGTSVGASTSCGAIRKAGKLGRERQSQQGVNHCAAGTSECRCYRDEPVHSGLERASHPISKSETTLRHSTASRCKEEHDVRNWRNAPRVPSANRTRLTPAGTRAHSYSRTTTIRADRVAWYPTAFGSPRPQFKSGSAHLPESRLGRLGFNCLPTRNACVAEHNSRPNGHGEEKR